jgi:O-antigen/teichoic acid export membrane protein
VVSSLDLSKNGHDRTARPRVCPAAFRGPGSPVTLLRDLRNYVAGRQTLRTHVWQSLANYAQQGFGLVFGIILARILTPGDFGSYALVLASVALAHLPVTWSLAPALVADAGRTPSLHGQAAGFAWCVVSMRAAIAGGLAAWYYATGKHEFTWLCVLIGVTESCRELNGVQRGYLEGAGNFKPNFIAAVAGIAFSCLVVIPTALITRSVYCLALPGLGGLAAEFVIYRVFSDRSILVTPQWRLPQHLFHSGFWIWIGTMSEIAFARLDKWFAGTFLGAEMLGFYNRAFGYAPLNHIFLNSLMSNPTVSGLARCETVAARSSLFWKTARLLLLGSAINWAVFFFFSREVVLFAFGPQWEGAVPIFRAFAPLSLAYAMAYLPAVTLLAAQRYRVLGMVRAGTLIAFLGIILATRGAVTATTLAWLLQGALAVQGILLFMLGRSFLSGR